MFVQSIPWKMGSEIPSCDTVAFLKNILQDTLWRLSLMSIHPFAPWAGCAGTPGKLWPDNLDRQNVLQRQGQGKLPWTSLQCHKCLQNWLFPPEAAPCLTVPAAYKWSPCTTQPSAYAVVWPPVWRHPSANCSEVVLSENQLVHEFLLWFH